MAEAHALHPSAAAFAQAIGRIAGFPLTLDFDGMASKELVKDLTRFASMIFPRKESLEVLRHLIRQQLTHEQMCAFVSGLEKYMARVHPDFCYNYCTDEEISAVASVDLMNVTFALKFMFMEYVTWEEVNAVNDEGKAILLATAGRFLPILRDLKAMRCLITDGESRPSMEQAVRDSPTSLELLHRLFAEEDENPVKETLMEDFFNKHAREDIWNKVYEITNADTFIEKNPSNNTCCYCLTNRLDCGNDFAIVNACWDLYCLRCVKRIGFGLGGQCARVDCKKDIQTYVSTNTYLKFRDEVRRNVLGPFQRQFLDPTHE